MRQILIENLPEADYHADNLRAHGIEEITISRGLAWRYHETKCLQEVYDNHPRLGGHKQPDKDCWKEGRLWHRYLAGENLRVKVFEHKTFSSKQAKADKAKAIAEGYDPFVAHKWIELERQMKEEGTPELAKLNIEGLDFAMREVTIVSEICGVFCRIRADFVIDYGDHILLGDYKTCTDLSDRALTRSANSYGYGFQASFYLAVAEAYFGKPCKWLNIYIRKQSPVRMRLSEIEPAYINHARTHQVEPALESIAGALKNNNWPGYGLHTLELPNWMEAQDGPDLDHLYSNGGEE